MKMDARIEGFLLRDPISWPRLATALSIVLRVDSDEISALADVTDEAPLVVVEHHTRQHGFRTDITLYLRGRAGAEPSDSLTLAEKMSRELQQEVLVSPPASWEISQNPFRWVLIQPDGRRFIAEQLDPDSDDIDINREPGAIRPL